MNDSNRILHPALRRRIVPAEAAAALIADGDNVGMSGFTGSGTPKAVPLALARRIDTAHQLGEPFRVGVWTGASTSPELDGALAKVNGMDLRLPYQSDPQCRQRINAGQMDYIDMHLSHVPQFVGFGFFGRLNVAVIEVSAVLEDGRLVPSTSVGNNKTWLDQADRVILEVNRWHDPGLEGLHDIYYGTDKPPHRQPLPLVHPNQRIGEPYLHVDLDRVVAVVETNVPDRHSVFSAPDAASQAIAGHLLEFLAHERRLGRLPPDLLPLQSGVGNIANAVLAGLNSGPFEQLTAYTEVLQDGMLDLLKSGKLLSASSSALALSEAAHAEFNRDIASYHGRVLLRSQGISNHPEIIRRLGLIAMNGMIEADIYGNVNSTHVMGSAIMNGIGGSGDFARNAYLSIFMAPSTAKDGRISTLVPMVSHVDHTEHDVQVIVTDQGLADLRGLSPRQRARVVIERCAHPDYRPLLRDYLARAEREGCARHTPHLLDEALGWHSRYLKTGQMRA